MNWGGKCPDSPPADGQAPPPWASLADPYEVLDHGDFKPILERRDRRITEDLRIEYDGKLKAATQRWEATQVHDRLSGMYGSLLEKLQGGADLPGADKLLDRFERLVAPYAAAYETGLLEIGIHAQGEAVNQMLLSDLDARSKAEMEDFLNRPQGTPVKEALDQWAKLKFGPKEAKYKDELLNKDDIIGRLKAELRTRQGPHLGESAPGRSDGIHSMNDADKAYNENRISHERYKDYRHQFGV